MTHCGCSNGAKNSTETVCQVKRQSVSVFLNIGMLVIYVITWYNEKW